MTEDTFLYLWEQGIVKAANDVVTDISHEMVKKYNVKLNISDLIRDKLYKEYHKFRKKIRQQYFDVGQNDENLIDGHKICSCITGSLMNVHLVSFDKNIKEIPINIVYSNYAMFNYRVEINSDGVERNVPKEHFSMIIARPDHKKLIGSSVQMN